MPNAQEVLDTNSFDIDDLVTGVEMSETDDVVLGLIDDGVITDEIVDTEPSDTVDTDTTETAPETETVVVAKAETKMGICRRIFAANFGKEGIARKHIIKMFEEQAGCSKACAGTYYQNLTKQ